ncbi:3-phosphoserine/phosphohydroxythreonine transaminase [Rhodoferax aquaticus]|uniref:Phosphoserine aminotransferase n=1 Tax=Rhodoferax aquaticus TaxID=2527691 RepID=A0A515ERG6_9BURK|nr:3-phosphoserine/phosphohydroxythreonine transaminase [Rhodoferax aquaticus]QDL55245.1 3-phosphoserine/phosphohydroxythreonine transaminase [Rhodoferax aquaticus]
MQRPYNFSAGPATIPSEVLSQAAAEMLNWPDATGRLCGMGVMEMSHRGKEFLSIYEKTEADLRELLNIPNQFKILFMQGGGLAENAIVPLNLSALRPNPETRGAADFVVTGSWSKKSLDEATKFCDARVAASDQINGFTRIPEPSTWNLREKASYVHLCTNETINGLEFHQLPDLKALGSAAELVIDFSSHVASRPVDWSRVGLAFGGAQKNLGPAGLTLVVVREDLLGHALPICPSAFDYQMVASNQSMYNTPPTYAIYIAGLVFQWLKRQGGVLAMEQQNIAKAKLLYDAIDQSSFYVNKVALDSRSRMNVPFFLRDESRNEAFLTGAKEAGLLQLKGHKSVGGMRASIYNAMPLEGVQTLVQYMREFERTLS